MRLVVPPVAAPLSLEDAKLWLRVDGADEDAVIADLIAAAVAYFDGRGGILGRALEAQTWEMALPGFSSPITLPLGPVASIVSITWRDSAGVARVMPAEDYRLDTRPVEAQLWPAGDWPAATARPGEDAVTIRWVAGTGCPPQVRQAIRQLVAHWHLSREAAGSASAELPYGVADLIAPWRRIAL